MANRNAFPLIRGRKMRVTRLDGCGHVVYGSNSQVVSDGFISVAATAQVTEAEIIEVLNANGKVCARDPGSPDFNGYGLEITFCEVQPCLFEMMTGQPPVKNMSGETIGFKMNSSINPDDHSGFAIEIWAGVPGQKCAPGGQGSYGYILFPFVGVGTIGDFTVENAAVNFVINQASTKDGNNWGHGPYNVIYDNAATPNPAPLPFNLHSNDHLLTIYTNLNPPSETDGCSSVTSPTPISITGVTAGTPGSFIPANANLPANLAALKSNGVVGDTGSSKPSSIWTIGQYILLGDNSEAYWGGSPGAWAAGRATGT